MGTPLQVIMQSPSFMPTAEFLAQVSERSVPDARYYDSVSWSLRTWRWKEVVRITGLPRGLIAGWHQHRLWSYGGTEVGTGDWRHFNLREIASFALAGILTRFGLSAGIAWELVNLHLDLILTDCWMTRTSRDYSVVRGGVTLTIPAFEIISEIVRRASPARELA